MMMKLTNCQISMSIDLKKNRIRVHKNSLRAMGDPLYIRLLFSTSSEAIVILKRDKAVPNGQEIKVLFDKPDSSGCFDIYSKELIMRIQNQFSGLNKKRLYNLKGFLIPGGGGVYFPLSSLTPEEETNV